jgi:hypothetical protein
MFGFCNIAFIPLRAEASHRAEMVTQLLFGEAYRIIDYQQTAGWAKIETQFDNYSGFIDIHQIALIHKSVYESYEQNLLQVAPSQITVFDKIRCFSFPISAGSTLLLDANNCMRMGAELFEIPALPKQIKDLKSIACSFLNTPYLWGGRSMYGIDCSGFNQLVFKIIGKCLPRDASQQAFLGKEITSLSQTQCGDLAFFHNKEGRTVHTGLILDKGSIIHSSGKVRIDVLDEQGIFCTERNEYSHQLQTIRRI